MEVTEIIMTSIRTKVEADNTTSTTQNSKTHGVWMIFL